MHKFEEFEREVRSALEAEGIELLLPLVPDLFFSSSEEDNEGESVQSSVTSNNETTTTECMHIQYRDAYNIMATSPLNNHSNRKLHEKKGLFDLLRAGPTSSVSEPIKYIDVGDTTYEKFQSEYVAHGGHPVMLRGVTENWPARERWKSENFIKNYGNVTVKVMEKRAEHGMGRPFLVRIPLALYEEYADTNTADDPFYAFEPDLTEARAVFLSDYKVPSFFTDDLYNLNEKTREFYPNYRHLIIGAERTGTNLHVDPKCTGAWNTLLEGHKKWAIFPPGTEEKYLKTLGTSDYAKMPATYWWQDIVPQLSSAEGMIECVQGPGETIFVPAGWWHTVLNLDFTIAITENLLMPVTLPLVWCDLQAGWPKFTEYLV